MKLDVYDLGNEKVGQVDVSEAIFDAPLHEHLHWEVTRAQLAGRRSGTASCKTRGEVVGSKKKMFRQKGTGRARHSTTKVNTSIGGGVAFGPKPRSYAQRLPKKVRKGALRSAISQKVRDGHIKVVQDFSLEEIKTNKALSVLMGLEVGRALVIDAKGNDNLRMSVRNLKDYKYLACEGLNVFDLLRFKHLVLTKGAIEQIEGVLQP